jgi:hypothetical protein
MNTEPTSGEIGAVRAKSGLTAMDRLGLQAMVGTAAALREAREVLSRPALAWATAYEQAVTLLLAALDERDALLRNWLESCSSPDDIAFCSACDDVPPHHAADCPVPATRTLLAQMEDV